MYTGPQIYNDLTGDGKNIQDIPTFKVFLKSQLLCVLVYYIYIFYLLCIAVNYDFKRL